MAGPVSHTRHPYPTHAAHAALVAALLTLTALAVAAPPAAPHRAPASGAVAGILREVVRWGVRELGDGYTFSECEAGDECAEGLECLGIKKWDNDIKSPCKNCTKFCSCLPDSGDDLETCLSCTQCSLYTNDPNTTKETCVEIEGEAIGVCLSKQLVLDGTFREKSCNTFPEASYDPPVTASPNSALPAPSATYEPDWCLDDEEGDGDDDGGTDDDDAGDLDEPQDDGDGDGDGEGDGDDGSFPGDICVDAALLERVSGLRRSDLVYARDVRASVLCDGWGTCATAGHMVVYAGVGMTMRSYCERISDAGGIDGSVSNCTRAVRFVNSPRFAFATRLKTMSPNLFVTPLAARYQTYTEATLLAAAIALGV